MLSSDNFVFPASGFGIPDVCIEQVSGFSGSASTRYFQLWRNSPGAGGADGLLFSLNVPPGQPFAWTPTPPGLLLVGTQSPYWAISTIPADYAASADTFWVQAIGRATVTP
jgi:hypothetical protein